MIFASDSPKYGLGSELQETERKGKFVCEARLFASRVCPFQVAYKEVFYEVEVNCGRAVVDAVVIVETGSVGFSRLKF